jgi:hypothetical protein
MMKFEGWRTQELQYVATLIAGREMIDAITVGWDDLYDEIIREIRNRRIHDELFQQKLNLEAQDNP